MADVVSAVYPGEREIFYQFISGEIPPKRRCTYSAQPRWSGALSFIRIRYASAVPTYAYVDSFQVDWEEFIWPYPEKQFPLELFADKGALAMEPRLRELFPKGRIIRIGSQVTIGIHNTTPEPLSVSVTFEWLELEK